MALWDTSNDSSVMFNPLIASPSSGGIRKVSLKVKDFKWTELCNFSTKVVNVSGFISHLFMSRQPSVFPAAFMNSAGMIRSEASCKYCIFVHLFNSVNMYSDTAGGKWHVPRNIKMFLDSLKYRRIIRDISFSASRVTLVSSLSKPMARQHEDKNSFPENVLICPTTKDKSLLIIAIWFSLGSVSSSDKPEKQSNSLSSPKTTPEFWPDQVNIPWTPFENISLCKFTRNLHQSAT